MKTKSIVIGTGVLGLLSGFLLSGNIGKNDLAKIATVATLLTIPTGIVAHSIGEGKGNRKANVLEDKLNAIEKNFNKSENELKATLEKLSKLGSELSKIRENLKTVTLERDTYQSIADSAKPAVATLQQKLENSLKSIGEWEIKYSELQEKCDSMEEIFDSELAAQVEEEVQRRLEELRKSEIKEVCRENDAITDEAMALMRRMKAWANKLSQRHEGLKDFTHELTNAYNGNIDTVVGKAKDLSSSFTVERDGYLTQIDCLHQRITLLQRELEGDLVEPVYLECGFDESGRIANALARLLWSDKQIPLKVTGVESNSDGSITAGFAYSRSMTPEALSQLIERDSSSIARTLGLYAVEKAYKLPITDCLAVKVRRDRPAKKTATGSLYRSKEEFIKYILSQPVRLRIVGEPGAGKTPTVAVLLSYLLVRGFLEANTPNGRKLPYCVVESCNPLAGISVKNGDELDFCLRWNDGKKGFKGLAEEYKFRKNPTNAEYKNSVGYIWVADEIDNTMAELTKDEAKPFKDALKDGGHVNLGVIVMGQSANVSTSKGLSIDDQKMMTNIYIDPVSIRTFLTQYGERFYSKKAVEKALNTLEELELEIEEQNEIICDTAREFRISMVTANRSPVFYQLPYFDSVAIDATAYQETLDKVSGIREGRGETRSDASVPVDSQTIDAVTFLQQLQKSGRSPMSVSGTRPDTSLKPACPHCGSDNIRSKGDKWMCQNSEHSTVAPNKPKSWKK